MSEPVATIVIIEDEPQIRRFLRRTLEVQGYRIAESETGRQGLIEAATQKPELVILDLGLPDMDGVEVVRQLRGWSAIPVIVLSARSQEADKIAALDAGADDYLTKPFGVGELLARMRVALRHAAAKSIESDAHEIIVDELRIDLLHRQVTVAGKEVHLTPIEYRLLSVLARNAGKVLTHRQLLNEVWGPSHVEETHYLRIYMGQLRQKLESDPTMPRHLVTETGVGYRFVP
jgi:two-component system, OmpR family, KDP operon response regulator KdpE